jgi:hypothetical protein
VPGFFGICRVGGFDDVGVDVVVVVVVVDDILLMLLN